MIVYVLALGGALLGTLGAGVVMIETTGNQPPTRIVTTITADPSATPVTGPEASPSIPATKAPPMPVDPIRAAEDLVTSLINIERSKNDCGPVRTDERLRTAARAHSADMAKYDYFSHVGRDGSRFWDRVALAGYPRNDAASENIASGQRTAKTVVQAWMNSPGHERNILNCESVAVGVGLAYRGDTPYWTQDFGRS